MCDVNSYTKVTVVLKLVENCVSENTDSTLKKQYICGFCGEEAYAKTDLIRHIRICPKFDVSTIDSDNESTTETHIACRGIDCSDEERVLPTQHCIDDTEQKFICSDCGHTFKQKGNMDKHRLKMHGVAMPSTRQTRHKMRVKCKVERYTTMELDSKRRARFVVSDSVTNDVLSDDNGAITLSKSECKKYVDNCNIIYGLISVYNVERDNIVIKTDSEIMNEWNTIKDAITSFMEDRPNQKDMISSIFQKHMNSHSINQ